VFFIYPATKELGEFNARGRFVGSKSQLIIQTGRRSIVASQKVKWFKHDRMGIKICTQFYGNTNIVFNNKSKNLN